MRWLIVLRDINQCPLLTHLGRRHVNFAGSFHAGHASQLERVVLVSFSFYLAPLSRLVVGAAGIGLEIQLSTQFGAADKGLEIQVSTQVVDPTAWAASFHDHQLDRSALEYCG